jgi:hypothetical protein
MSGGGSGAVLVNGARLQDMIVAGIKRRALEHAARDDVQRKWFGISRDAFVAAGTPALVSELPRMHRVTRRGARRLIVGRRLVAARRLAPTCAHFRCKTQRVVSGKKMEILKGYLFAL